MRGEHNFFVYDHMDGIDFYATEAEAKDRCEALLDEERLALDDSGWNENVTDICYGKVLGGVVQTACEKAPEGSGFDEMWDFAVKEYPDPDPAERAP